jgi:hypothetical protein
MLGEVEAEVGRGNEKKRQVGISSTREFIIVRENLPREAIETLMAPETRSAIMGVAGPLVNRTSCTSKIHGEVGSREETDLEDIAGSSEDDTKSSSKHDFESVIGWKFSR